MTSSTCTMSYTTCVLWSQPYSCHIGISTILPVSCNAITIFTYANTTIHNHPQSQLICNATSHISWYARHAHAYVSCICLNTRWMHSCLHPPSTLSTNGHISYLWPLKGLISRSVHDHLGSGSSNSHGYLFQSHTEQHTNSSSRIIVLSKTRPARSNYIVLTQNP